MSKFKELLAQVADRLALNKPLLARAQRSYKANRKRAYVAHNQQVRAQGRADMARKAGQLILATQRDKEAARHGIVAFNNHTRAQVALGEIKKFQARVNKIGADQAHYEAELKRLDKVTIKGNKATGGKKQERLKAVALASAANCASGSRANFYSQAGSWDVDHCITGERYGERSDCSSWFTSVYKSCGQRDPNGESYNAGYTGTLVAHGTQISKPEVGCAVIYGSGVGHHVEMYVGPGSKTIGHGSSPVDAGVIDLFGDGDYRFFKFN